MRWSASQALAWIILQKPLKLEEREWTPNMGPGLKDAQKELARVIAASEVQAWGRKQPHGSVKKIPSDPFRISGLTVVVGAHGDMTTLVPHI
jgi:hypothetical protein